MNHKEMFLKSSVIQTPLGEMIARGDEKALYLIGESDQIRKHWMKQLIFLLKKCPQHIESICKVLKENEYPEAEITRLLKK